jgi:hypothetical protein
MARGAGWSKDAFPPLELAVDEQRHYQDLARGLVWETLAHYDAYDRPGHRVMDKKRWKAVKARENLTVYKERDSGTKKRANSRQHAPSVDMERLAADDWQAPKLLLGVGTIIGSLDDVMYGVVTPDAPSMLLKAQLVRSSLIDGAVLAQIRSPTPSEPYRFLGIKWFVKGPPSTLRGIVWPRDLVFVESTGVMVRSNGDRIGYQLLHSVDIPGYGPLEEQSLMRGRISSCTIFRELPSGRKVDVYVRGYVEQHGKLLDSVALKAASTGFLSSWNAVECGQMRKLLWFAEHPERVDWSDRDGGAMSDGARSDRSGSGRSNATPTSSSMSRSGGPSSARSPRRSNRQYPHAHQHQQVALLGSDLESNVFSMASQSSATHNTSRDRQRRCGSCARKFGLVSGGATGFCKLCNCAMCAKCRSAKKLPYVTYNLTLETREAPVCRTCVMHVRQFPSEQLARDEVLDGRYGWRPRATPTASTDQSTSSYNFDSLTAASPSARSPYAAAAPSFQGRRGSATPISIGLRPRNSSAHSGGSSASSTHERESDPRRIVLHSSTPLGKACNELRSASIDTISTTLSSSSTLFRPVSGGGSGDAAALNSFGGSSWRSSFNEEDEELERRLRVDEADEDDWTQTPPFTESQRHRQHLWQQMTELRLAAENTYRLAKTTTDSVMQTVGHV